MTYLVVSQTSWLSNQVEQVINGHHSYSTGSIHVQGPEMVRELSVPVCEEKRKQAERKGLGTSEFVINEPALNRQDSFGYYELM